MKTLPIEPLTSTTFSPFGDVIEVANHVKHFPINAGNTERYHDLMKIDVDADGHPIVSIFRGLARVLPFEIKMMERHPLGSQSFIPLQGRRYLVVVAQPTNTLLLKDVRVFLAEGHQGVNYARGVWHHPLLALDDTSDFLVIDRSGPGNNCEEHYFSETIWIDFPK